MVSGLPYRTTELCASFRATSSPVAEPKTPMGLCIPFAGAKSATAIEEEVLRLLALLGGLWLAKQS